MLKITNLSKSFTADTVIHYSDLVFEDGKSYMLLGASGCGKSTLLNMLAGVITPSSGTVEIKGKIMSAMSQKEKDAFRIAKIGYIFQDFKLIEEMTVAENISVLQLEGVDISRTDELLSKLGIADKKKKKVKTLSGGEKQRTAIIRALVKSPEIILADEPTGNLNYEIGKTVVAELLEAARGKTLIAVTHDDRLAPMFDCVIDMNAVTSLHPAEGGEN